MSTKESEMSLKSVLEIVSTEISNIAAEIENIDLMCGENLNDEKIVALQSIDFCSQRLADMSALAKFASREIENTQSDSVSGWEEVTKLEHTHKLLNSG